MPLYIYFKFDMKASVAFSVFSPFLLLSLRQGLTMWSRLPLNFQSSCLSISSPGITDYANTLNSILLFSDYLRYFHIRI